MAEEAPTSKFTPQQEIKQKLRETRLHYNRAKKLIVDIEKNHDKFAKIRDSLRDKENGVEANQVWIAKQRSEIVKILDDAKSKLSELEGVATTVSASVGYIESRYEKFKPLAEQIFDKKDGLDAVLKATRRLSKATNVLSKKIESNADNADKKLESITKITDKVDKAYTAFIEKKNQIDDKENGFEAQLLRATEYATSAQDAKAKSENALVSITNFKDQSDELVEQIKDSKASVDTYQKESEALTKDIRNTLDKATAFTLSKALQDRAKSFNRQMWFWSVSQVFAIALLTYGVYLIFQALFVGTQGHPAISGNGSRADLLTVISKFLFTTPLIFAVYVATSNYKHARDLRDRYAWKETVSKNFQNYIKLVKDEFNNEKYEEERFKFSMETVRSIYTEPNPLPKKRKYNFSLKMVQFNVEEEDLQELRQALFQDISSGVSVEERPSKGVIEETAASAIESTAEKIKTKVSSVKKQATEVRPSPTKS